MKAIILAAGQGTRLKKYTENLPKGMLFFMGKTIIGRQIELYRKCGIEDITIVTGYASDKINYEGVKYYHNERFSETNMVETMLCAKAEFDTDLIISYSDILFEKNLLVKMMESTADYACAVDDNWQEYWQLRYGRVDCDTESLAIGDEDNITELGLENPSLENIDARYIGVLKFSQRGLKAIEKIMAKAYENFGNKPWQQSGKTAQKAYMTDLLNALIESGQEVKAVHFHNGWVEFDTNEDYEKALEWEKTGVLSRFLDI